MRETLFAKLASLGEQFERTTSRLELASLLAEFLQKLDPAEIPAGVRLTIGQVFPEWDGRALKLSWKATMKVVGGLASPTDADREAIFAEAEDTGEAVRMLLERARSERPQPPPPTILDVYRTLEEIAAAAGRGSRKRKEELLQALAPQEGGQQQKETNGDQSFHIYTPLLLIDGQGGMAGPHYGHICLLRP